MDLLKERLYCPGGSVRDPLHNAPILAPALVFLLGTFQKSVFDGLRRLGLSVGTSKHLPHRDFNMQTCSAGKMCEISPQFAAWIRCAALPRAVDPLMEIQEVSITSCWSSRLSATTCKHEKRNSCLTRPFGRPC